MLKVHHCAIPKIQNNDTERERDRQTDRDKDTQRDRQRYRETEREEEEELGLMPCANRHIDLKHQETSRTTMMKAMKPILYLHTQQHDADVTQRVTSSTQTKTGHSHSIYKLIIITRYGKRETFIFPLLNHPSPCPWR